jgi:hypothetical protein
MSVITFGTPVPRVDRKSSATRHVGRACRLDIAARARQPEATGWDLAGGLPTWERELVTAEFEEVGELVGAGAENQE